MIDAPDDSAITVENILLPHRERTMRRMKAQATALCIQDGTDLNFSGLAQCEGLGTIGTNQTGANSLGLHLHSTLAVTTAGIPLGVPLVQCFAPEPKSKEDDRPSSAIPIEEKKTFSWIVGFRD
ncbi:MAG: transposase, partial [Elusimicrobiota bacterium]